MPKNTRIAFAMALLSVDAPVVALTGVRVIDGSGAAAVENQTIVIADMGSQTAVVGKKLARPRRSSTRRRQRSLESFPVLYIGDSIVLNSVVVCVNEPSHVSARGGSAAGSSTARSFGRCGCDGNRFRAFLQHHVSQDLHLRALPGEGYRSR